MQELNSSPSAAAGSEESRLLSGAYNLTIRTIARGGELVKATELLEEAMQLEHLMLDNATVRGIKGTEDCC